MQKQIQIRSKLVRIWICNLKSESAENTRKHFLRQAAYTVKYKNTIHLKCNSKDISRYNTSFLESVGCVRNFAGCNLIWFVFKYSRFCKGKNVSLWFSDPVDLKPQACYAEESTLKNAFRKEIFKNGTFHWYHYF